MSYNSLAFVDPIPHTFSSSWQTLFSSLTEYRLSLANYPVLMISVILSFIPLERP